MDTLIDTPTMQTQTGDSNVRFWPKGCRSLRSSNHAKRPFKDINKISFCSALFPFLDVLSRKCLHINKWNAINLNIRIK